MLGELTQDVLRIRGGAPKNPIVLRIASVMRRHALSLEPLERLIEANRRDQSLRFVSSWNELLDGCTRSANPVGELVLGILGQANAQTIPPSNAVCSALQVVEHCQDVREDFVAGRIYLPAEDMERFGCQRWDLKQGRANSALRNTIRLQVDRARELLSEADLLLPRLRGIAIPLIAGYAAGGLATCDALERHDFDVLAFEIRPRRRDLFRHWLGLCWRATRARVRR
jgi:phytoene synthase